VRQDEPIRERVSKEYRLQINLEKTAMLKTLKKCNKNTVIKMNGKEIKEVDKFVYLVSVVEKNGKIQNKINKRIGKASEFYHLAKSLLWNKDTDGKCKITMFNMCFKNILLHEAETWAYTKREENCKQLIRNL
jgi:hypothetical protein